MGALPSKEIQEGILDDLLDMNQESKIRDQRRRVVLIPMTKRFMCRVPAENSDPNSPTGSATGGDSRTPQSPQPAPQPPHDGNVSTAAAAASPNSKKPSRGSGMSLPAVVNTFAKPSEYPLVQQVYEAYCGPNVQFFCRKDGWGPSLHEMPESLYYPTIDDFYAATVEHYEGQLLETNRDLQQRFDTLRLWKYKNKNLDKNPNAPNAKPTETGASAATPAPSPPSVSAAPREKLPPPLLPTPCAICFHYPTNRLATAENPYDPTVYTLKTRGNRQVAVGQDTSAGSGGSEDSSGRRGRRRCLAPSESVVIGPRSSLMAIGFVGLVPTKRVRPASAPSPPPQKAASGRTGGAGGGTSAATTATTHPERQGPVPFLKPPAENDAVNGSSVDATSTKVGKTTADEGDGKEEYELVIFLSKSGGSFFMTRSLFMAISLYTRQCDALKLSFLPLPPIRYSALLTDLVHQSFLREIRVRVAQAGTTRSVPGKRHKYERLLYTLRQKVKVSGQMLTGCLSGSMADQLFHLVWQWWTNVELNEEANYQQSLNAIAEKKGKGKAAPSSDAPVPEAAKEDAAEGDNRSNDSGSKKRKKPKDAETMGQVLAPARYIFYGFVGDSASKTDGPPQGSCQPILEELPTSGGPHILDKIRNQVDFAAREEAAAVARRKPTISTVTTSTGTVAVRPPPRMVVAAEHLKERIPSNAPTDSSTNTTAGPSEPQADAEEAAEPLSIYAVVGPGGIRKSAELLKYEEERRQEQIALFASEDDEVNDDDTGNSSSSGGSSSGTGSRSSRGSRRQPRSQVGYGDIWREGTVLMQKVDRYTGAFLLPYWEVAFEDENHVLGFLQYHRVRRAVAGDSQELSGSRRKGRRSRRKNKDSRGGSGGDGTEAEEDGDISGNSSQNDELSGGSSNSLKSSNGSNGSNGSLKSSNNGSNNSLNHGRKRVPIVRRKLRLVPPYDVVLSWIKDNYVFARSADPRDPHWKKSYTEAFFTEMAARSSALRGSRGSCLGSNAPRVELTKETLASLRMSSEGTSYVNQALQDADDAGNAAGCAAAKDTYIWEFVHQGKTYGIALTPNFAREAAATEQGENNSTEASTEDSVTGGMGVVTRAANVNSNGNRKDQAPSKSKPATTAAADGLPQTHHHERGYSDVEVGSTYSQRTDPNSEDMSADSTSKSSKSTLSAFNLQTAAERRQWKMQHHKDFSRQQQHAAATASTGASSSPKSNDAQSWSGTNSQSDTEDSAQARAQRAGPGVAHNSSSLLAPPSFTGFPHHNVSDMDAAYLDSTNIAAGSLFRSPYVSPPAYHSQTRPTPFESCPPPYPNPQGSFQRRADSLPVSLSAERPPLVVAAAVNSLTKALAPQVPTSPATTTTTTTNQNNYRQPANRGTAALSWQAPNNVRGNNYANTNASPLREGGGGSYGAPLPQTSATTSTVDAGGYSFLQHDSPRAGPTVSAPNNSRTNHGWQQPQTRPNGAAAGPAVGGGGDSTYEFDYDIDIGPSPGAHPYRDAGGGQPMMSYPADPALSQSLDPDYYGTDVPPSANRGDYPGASGNASTDGGSDVLYDYGVDQYDGSTKAKGNATQRDASFQGFDYTTPYQSFTRGSAPVAGATDTARAPPQRGASRLNDTHSSLEWSTGLQETLNAAPPANAKSETSGDSAAMAPWPQPYPPLQHQPPPPQRRVSVSIAVPNSSEGIRPTARQPQSGALPPLNPALRRGTDGAVPLPNPAPSGNMARSGTAQASVKNSVSAAPSSIASQSTVSGGNTESSAGTKSSRTSTNTSVFFATPSRQGTTNVDAMKAYTNPSSLRQGAPKLPPPQPHQQTTVETVTVPVPVVQPAAGGVKRFMTAVDGKKRYLWDWRTSN